MSKPHIDAKTMAMIYKTRDAIEEIEEGAWEKFMANIEFSFTKELLKSECSSGMVIRAFTWDDVAEGHNYWSDIYTKLLLAEEGAS
jgi:hypothetical protein